MVYPLWALEALECAQSIFHHVPVRYEAVPHDGIFETFGLR
jgi:hypothetical protein